MYTAQLAAAWLAHPGVLYRFRLARQSWPAPLLHYAPVLSQTFRPVSLGVCKQFSLQGSKRYDRVVECELGVLHSIMEPICHSLLGATPLEIRPVCLACECICKI